MKLIIKIKTILFLSAMIMSLTVVGQNGTMEAEEGIIVGNNTGTTNGTIRFNGLDFEGRTLSGWRSLTSPWAVSGFNTSRLLGNIGMGTLTPTQKLDISFTGNNGIKLTGNDAGDARIWITNGGGSHFIFDDDSDGHSLDFQSAGTMNFMTNGSNERMQILSGGEIGINIDGNTNHRMLVNETDKLFGLTAQNVGDFALRGINFETGNSTSFGTYGAVSNSTASGTLYGLYGFVNFVAPANAKYGVYGTSDSSDADSWAVYANGDMAYTGTLTFISDQGYKKDIRPLESMLDKVLQVETKRYEMRNDEFPYLNLADGPQIGFISQNIETIFPELVESQTHSYVTNDHEQDAKPIIESQEILALKVVEMIPILTKAMQEQQEIINEQESKIDALENQNRDIMSRLSALEK